MKQSLTQEPARFLAEWFLFLFLPFQSSTLFLIYFFHLTAAAQKAPELRVGSGDSKQPCPVLAGNACALDTTPVCSVLGGHP